MTAGPPASGSAVCTLFEGSYHHGVAALTNSLHHAGFRGDVFAGHRGALPSWAAASTAIDTAGWRGARALAVSEALRIVFLPLETPYHLTNYKPEFMLALLDGPLRDASALFYLDPDICITHPWRFFEEWVACGVALCEDVNSPLPQNHPRRIGWRRYFGARGVALQFRGAEYVNGGFVGVRAADREFLLIWQRLMELMTDEIGSLTVGLAQNGAYKSTGFADCFDRTDQDALNAAVEAWEPPVCAIGQEAMAFKPGAALMPHALGSGKPWQRSYLRAALQGLQPRTADRAFWRHVDSPIAVYGALHSRLRRFELAAAAALGRVYRRS